MGSDQRIGIPCAGPEPSITGVPGRHGAQAPAVHVRNVQANRFEFQIDDEPPLVPVAEPAPAAPDGRCRIVLGDDVGRSGDEEDIARRGGVTADDRVEVQPWIEKEGRFSFVTSDPKAVDLAAFKRLPKTND